MMELVDSKIEWIGEIPSDWTVYSLSQVVDQVKNKNKDLEEKNLLSLSYGKIKRKDIESSDGLLPASFDNYNIIEEGDIVLRLTDLQNDHTSLRVGRATERGIITSAYCTIRPTEKEYSRFLYYLLHAYDIKKGFYGMGSGVRQGLNFSEVKQLRIAMPGKEVIESIVSFLDEKCKLIDEMVAENSECIKELKKYKNARITEVITRGLHKDASFKKTKYEWLCDIPYTWDVIPLKRMYDSSNGAAVKVGPFGSALSGTDFVEEGVWVYNQRSVLDDNFVSNDTFVSEKKADELQGFEVSEGDLLITTRGSIGRVAIVPQGAPKGVIHPCIIRFRIDEKFISKKLLKLICNESDFIQKQVLRLSNSTTVEVLYSYTLKELIVPLIPHDEMVQIESYLEKFVTTINSMIELREKTIRDLNEYKNSLIYEIITGKKEV